MEAAQIEILKQIESAIKAIKESKTISEERRVMALNLYRELHLICSQDTLSLDDVLKCVLTQVELDKVAAMPNRPFVPLAGIPHGKPEGEFTFPNFKEVN